MSDGGAADDDDDGAGALDFTPGDVCWPVAMAVTRRHLVWHADKHRAFDALFAAALKATQCTGRRSQTPDACVARRLTDGGGGGADVFVFSASMWQRIVAYVMCSARDSKRWRHGVRQLYFEVPTAVVRAYNVACADTPLTAFFPNAVDADAVRRLRPLDCIFSVLDYQHWGLPPIGTDAVAAAVAIPSSSSSSSSSATTVIVDDSDSDSDDDDDSSGSSGSDSDSDDDDTSDGAFSDTEQLLRTFVHSELETRTVGERQAIDAAIMLFVDVFGETVDDDGALASSGDGGGGGGGNSASLHVVDDALVLQRYEAAAADVRRCLRHGAHGVMSDAVRRSYATLSGADALWASDEERATYGACIEYLQRFDFKRTVFVRYISNNTRRRWWAAPARGHMARIVHRLSGAEMRTLSGGARLWNAADVVTIGADSVYLAVRRADMTMLDLRATAHWLRPSGARLELAWADREHLYVCMSAVELHRLQVLIVPRLCAYFTTFRRPMPAPLAPLHMSNYASREPQRVKSALIALMRSFTKYVPPLRAPERSRVHTVLHRFFEREWAAEQHAPTPWAAERAECRAFMWAAFVAPYRSGVRGGLFATPPAAGQPVRFQSGRFFVYTCLRALCAPSDQCCIDVGAANELVQQLVLHPQHADALAPWPVATGLLKCVRHAAAASLMVGDTLCVHAAVVCVLRDQGVSMTVDGDGDGDGGVDDDRRLEGNGAVLDDDEATALRACLLSGACMMDHYYDMFGAERLATACAPLGVHVGAETQRALELAAHCAFTAVTPRNEQWRWGPGFAPAQTPPGRVEMETRRISLQKIDIHGPTSPASSPDDASMCTLAVAFEVLEYLSYMPVTDADGHLMPVAAASASAAGAPVGRPRSLGRGLPKTATGGRKRGRPPKNDAVPTRASSIGQGAAPALLMPATYRADAALCPVQWDVASGAWQTLRDTLPVIVGPLPRTSDAPTAHRDSKYGRRRVYVHAPATDAASVSMSPLHDVSSAFMYVALHRSSSLLPTQ